VIVDNQHCCSHTRMVAQVTSSDTPGFP
jgi:hypothetical protein